MMLLEFVVFVCSASKMKEMKEKNMVSKEEHE
jgi:hypothetical protein